jgi:hypothetical protein
MTQRPGKEISVHWEWEGKEDMADKSGVLTLEFSAGKTRIELPDFGEAHCLAQLIRKEIQEAERRGTKIAVGKYASLGKDMTEGACRY